MEEVDSKLHECLRLVQDFSRGSNSRCDSKSKRKRIRSGVRDSTEMLQSHDKTLMDKEMSKKEKNKKKNVFLRQNKRHLAK